MKRLTTLLLVFTMLISLTACGSGSSAAKADAEAPQAAPETAAEVPAQDAQDAAADPMAISEEVVEEGMVPIGAENLVDGVYPVEMKSSSAMFKADHCELSVKDGRMEVTLYMTSGSYSFMFCGSAADAAGSDESARIPLAEGSEFNTFTLPLENLDEGADFSAFSKKKELWYDRTLLFRSDSLPIEAFAEGFLKTAESLGLSDGEYTAEVRLSGGTGKATVSSPARITVANGVCTAEIIWSSSKYDYVKIGEEQFFPVNTEGNSTFLLPVAFFDRGIAILADTTAMSQAHEIAYSLRFDSETIQPAS